MEKVDRIIKQFVIISGCDLMITVISIALLDHEFVKRKL